MISTQILDLPTGHEKRLVFNIKRFAIHDGPGIRTTVFMKGCPLHCPWCQNPEGLTNRKNVMFDNTSCIGCYLCVENCPNDAITSLSTKSDIPIKINRIKCKLNGKCIEICPSNALKFDSQWMTPEMILDEVLKDKIFYKYDNGGVTSSGGEPLYDPIFLKKCVELCKNERLHVALDTTLMTNWKNIEEFIGFIDLFIVDLKIFDENLHDNIVGGSGLLIKENIKKLNNFKENILLRTPLIPGFTATKNNLQEIGAFNRELTLKNENMEFELLNYNPYAKIKYKKLGLEFDKAFDRKKYTDEEMKYFYTLFK